MKIKECKIFKTAMDEYLIMADNEKIQKIQGKHALSVIAILSMLQKEKNIENSKSILASQYDEEHIDSVIDWLNFNGFIETSHNENITVNIIAEFSENHSLTKDLISTISESYNFNQIINPKEDLSVYEFGENTLTILLGSFWYFSEIIEKISDKMIESKGDFLYVEFYENGISLGPLLSPYKGTACLNCINIRKIFNLSKPQLIIENFTDRTLEALNEVEVVNVGNYETNKTFVLKALDNIINKGLKNLYNKSVFIDFLNFDNQYFHVMKAPNCKVCNSQISYTPL